MRVGECDDGEDTDDEAGQNGRRDDIQREHDTLPRGDVATHGGRRADRVECIEIGTHVRGRQGDDEGDRGRGGNNGDKRCDVGQDEGTHRRDDDLSRGAGHLAGNRRLERRSIDGTDLLLD